MQASEVTRRMVALAALYPNAKPSQEMFDGYAKQLRDLLPEALDAACKRAVNECKFFPTIAELRSMSPIVPVETIYVDTHEYFDFELEDRERTEEETAMMVSDDRNNPNVPTFAEIRKALTRKPDNIL